MSVNTIPTRAEALDPLTEQIRDSIIGVGNLRAENRELLENINSLESTKLRLETEVRSLKLTLEEERAERRHYHLLSNEIITRLDVVGQTIDDVVKQAEQEVRRQRRENPRAELPNLKAPAFLRKIEAALSDSDANDETSETNGAG